MMLGKGFKKMVNIPKDWLLEERLFNSFQMANYMPKLDGEVNGRLRLSSPETNRFHLHQWHITASKLCCRYQITTAD